VFIDYLYQDEKIVHVSSNLTFAELINPAVMPYPFNPATIRRLQDICEYVKF
jgi:hypothetical protein